MSNRRKPSVSAEAVVTPPHHPRASRSIDLDASETARVAEMRQVEAVLSGRSRRAAAVNGSFSKGRRIGFWAAIIALEVLAFLWLRWAYEVYVSMKARYHS